MSHSDDAIEREIVSKGLTAPRVTLDDIKANIASEHYFTAQDGVRGNGGQGDKITEWVSPVGQALSLLTFCVLVLRNGFTVTGKSACASPEYFDAEIGKKIARDDAINQLWPLMSYALKERLFQASLIQCEVGKVLGVKIIEGDKPAIPPHQQRVIDEKRELDEKLTKLADFIDSSAIFAGLPVDEKDRLKAQSIYMRGYSAVLANRIAAFGSAA